MPKTDKEKQIRDSEILDMFFSRDQKAVDSVADRYGKLFRRIAFNITRDDMTADEVLNDTYLALWNSIPPERPGDLAAYGSAVARNIAVGRVRRERAAKRPQTVCELDEALPAIDPDPAPDDGRLTALLEKFLRGLDSRSRVLFVIRYFEEDSLESAAERTGTTVSAVKSNLHRTREKLRRFLEREGYSI